MTAITKTAPIVAAALFVVCAVAVWKMWDFRAKWHDATSNTAHEMRLANAGVLRSERVLLFGDSQIAYWPMASSFGVLPFVNRGRGGDWATNARSRYDAAIAEVKPNTVVILIGTNDVGNGKTLDQIEESIRAMVDRAAGAKIILCSVLPVRGEAQRLRPPEKIRALNERLRSLAGSKGAQYLDLHALLAGEDGLIQERYTTDELHISREGYVVMTRALLRAWRDAEAS